MVLPSISYICISISFPLRSSDWTNRGKAINVNGIELETNFILGKTLSILQWILFRYTYTAKCSTTHWIVFITGNKKIMIPKLKWPPTTQKTDNDQQNNIFLSGFFLEARHKHFFALSFPYYMSYEKLSFVSITEFVWIIELVETCKHIQVCQCNVTCVSLCLADRSNVSVLTYKFRKSVQDGTCIQQECFMGQLAQLLGSAGIVY